MQYIEIDLPLGENISIQYPVGSNIAINYPRIELMATLFCERFKSDLTKNITLYCMGSSGAIIATIFYQILSKLMPDIKIEICHVKKSGEESHSGAINFSSSNISVFVDDFISSGQTVRTCIDKIKTYGYEFESFDYIVVSWARNEFIKTTNPNYFCSKILFTTKC